MRNPILFPETTGGDYAFTLRDLAAIAAMQGLLANPRNEPENAPPGIGVRLSDDAEAYAFTAVKLADALLAELEK